MKKTKVYKKVLFKLNMVILTRRILTPYRYILISPYPLLTIYLPLVRNPYILLIEENRELKCAYPYHNIPGDIHIERVL